MPSWLELEWWRILFFHAAACYSVEGTLVFEQVRRRRLRCDARPTWWILITQSTHPTPTEHHPTPQGEKETLSILLLQFLAFLYSHLAVGAALRLNIFLSEGTFFCRVVSIPLLFPPPSTLPRDVRTLVVHISPAAGNIPKHSAFTPPSHGHAWRSFWLFRSQALVSPIAPIAPIDWIAPAITLLIQSPT